MYLLLTVRVAEKKMSKPLSLNEADEVWDGRLTRSTVKIPISIVSQQRLLRTTGVTDRSRSLYR